VKALPGWRRVQYVAAVPRVRMLEIMGESCAAIVLYARGPNNMDVRSNRLFEAMAAGLPVIAPDFPKWRATVEGKCGVCVDPHDPRQIAEACEFLVGHPAEAERMGRAGRDMFLREFNWDAEKKRLIGLYDNVCARPESVSHVAAVAEVK